jgi:hypothetical protein
LGISGIWRFLGYFGHLGYLGYLGYLRYLGYLGYLGYLRYLGYFGSSPEGDASDGVIELTDVFAVDGAIHIKRPTNAIPQHAVRCDDRAQLF